MEMEDKTIGKKEYHRQYYEKNKEKMKMQIKEKQPNNLRRKIIKKLNDNEYSRLPYTKLDKYNIKFDEDKKIYF
jgi:hypothetical protein